MTVLGQELPCVAPIEKLRDYLLDASHPIGGPKARFFLAHGFEVDDIATLSRAMIRHASENEINAILKTRHGTKYRVSGRLHTPDGRNPRVITVWIQDSGAGVARLVTAYPR